jgi:hypothetical protein
VGWASSTVIWAGEAAAPEEADAAVGGGAAEDDAVVVDVDGPGVGEPKRWPWPEKGLYLAFGLT